MRKVLTVILAVVLIQLPALAHEELPGEVPHCAPGLIHVMPYCLTEAEHMASWSPPPPPVDPGASYGPQIDQWRSLVIKYWPADRVPWALAILKCESGGDPWADNPYSTARGLFQFLRSTWDRGPAPALGLPSYNSGAPYVAEWNIQAGAWLYANWGGKSQWSCKSRL